MKIRLFYHSLLSDWNHGNAHFLRGIVTQLQKRGHDVVVFEPEDAWSLQNLIAEHGEEPLRRFQEAYPGLSSVRYRLDTLDLEAAVADADLVIVHEWSDHALVKRMGELRQEHPFVLLFHDTHHRLITRPQEMHGYDLSHYDGVLAYGQVLADLYLETKLARRVWTWHEAADTERFKPKPESPKEGDLVWIGNWGDDERTEELREFLIQPVRDLQLRAAVYGVRYPEHALKELAAAGIEYRGWLPNFDVPDVFARYRVTVHVPRRPYVRALPGIPTIRPFEAMACGIPMVTSPWQDAEGLFNAGQDYLMAQSGAEMTATLQMLLSDDAKAAEVAAHGLATVQKRHTCGHRVEELLAIYEDVRSEIPRPRRTAGQTRATALPNSSPKALAS